MKAQQHSVLFSVLIANYNNGQYLQTAVESVLQQTYLDCEIIIYDDKSTDESEKFYKKWEADKRIKVFQHTENQGCGHTKFDAVQVATGDILGFLDPDDKLRPDALEIMVNAHQEHPQASLIYSSFYRCDETLKIVSEVEKFGALPPGKTNLEADKISHFATFKRSAYQKTSGINKKYPRAVDKDLYYKLEEVGEVVYIDEPLYFYRIHKGGISTLQNIGKAKVWALRAQVAAFKRRNKASKYIPIIRKNYQIYYFRRAKQALRELNLRESLYSLWKYFFGSPFKEF